MSGAANPKLGLRPALPADGPLLIAIFRASIGELTSDDYSETQQEAWASAADDEGAFLKRVMDNLALVATLDGSPVAFATLKGNRVIDMLYVHPAGTRRGAASLLCDALEKLAAGRGTESIAVDASDTAKAFFEKRGYVPKLRNTVMRNDEWLANTTMDKPLASKGEAS
ncbi:MAG TPA: GNAT family N-acetyltransferase [Xanthobacteraceae bacterium]|nr:GNAT family N-acetyltransferase [Xanthobacteraceae bacterium]